MKKKSLAGILSLLICIALIGVGFASWVITAGDTETATGNVKVETIEDQRVFLENIDLDNENIVFGTPEGAANDGWLKNSSIGTEVLTTTLTGTIKTKDKNALTRFTIVLETNKASAFDEELIGAFPTVSAPAIDSLSWSAADSNGYYTANFEVTATFTWGSKWEEYKNPYTFYNAHVVNDLIAGDATPEDSSDDVTYGDQALKDIKAIYEALNGATYTFTIKVNQE